MNIWEAHVVLQITAIVTAVVICYWRLVMELFGLSKPYSEIGERGTFMVWTKRGTRVVTGVHRAGTAASRVPGKMWAVGKAIREDLGAIKELFQRRG